MVHNESYSSEQNEYLLSRLKEACTVALETSFEEHLIEQDVAEVMEQSMTLAVDYDQESHTLSVEITSPGGKAFEAAVIDLFFDLFAYLDLNKITDTKGEIAIYKLHWDVGGIPWYLETDPRLIPDTGGVTREEWDKFIAQLIFYVGGTPRTLPTPDFIDDSAPD